MKVRVIKYSPELEEALTALMAAKTMQEGTISLFNQYMKVAQVTALVSIARSLEIMAKAWPGPTT